MHIQNIHTMDELKMTGNCLKGSRPLLSFDKGFEERPHFALLKEMFTQIFGVPRLARRSKPFIDHVISFSILDGKVWFRHYQIVEKDTSTDKKATKEQSQPTLVEIGPRMVMTPIRIFEGSFGGPTVYENPGKENYRQKRQKLTLAIKNTFLRTPCDISLVVRRARNTRIAPQLHLSGKPSARSLRTKRAPTN